MSDEGQASREMTAVEIIDCVVQLLCQVKLYDGGVELAYYPDRILRYLASAKAKHIALNGALERSESIARQWIKAAGWEIDATRDLPLPKLLKAMLSVHCSERSYADLQASGGLPETKARTHCKGTWVAPDDLTHPCERLVGHAGDCGQEPNP